ncbi:MAG: hypothetical protein Q8R11_02210, partial [bacterium]|nr:hypothetical protein [bacterium]
GNGTGWARVMPCTPAQIQEITKSSTVENSGTSMVGVNVGGEIEKKWNEFPWLGPVVRAERSADPYPHGTTGRVADFTGGFIHQSRYGTFETHGDIAKVYVQERGSGGWLGFPTSNEFRNAAGHAQSNFEGGYITWQDYDPSLHRAGEYVAFDSSGCRYRDCGNDTAMFRGFVNFAESVTGTQANLETLTDADVDLLHRGLSGGMIGIDFIGGTVVKLGIKGVAQSVKLSLIVSKELTVAQRSLVNVLERVRLEKAVEKLGGKLAWEYWDDIRAMAHHFERHAAEFWPGITLEEYTAIGKEVLENAKKMYSSLDYPGQYIVRDKANKIIVFTNKSKDKIYSIFKESEQYIEDQIRKGVIIDE